MNNRAAGLVGSILFAVYTICCILLITTGISVYRSIVHRNEETDGLHLSMNYVINKLRNNDISNSVSIEERNGINTLVLKYEGGNDCETLIYFLDDCLYEMFKFTDSDISPEFGVKICSLNDFDMSMNDRFMSFHAEDTNGQTMNLSYKLMTAQGD